MFRISVHISHSNQHLTSTSQHAYPNFLPLQRHIKTGKCQYNSATEFCGGETGHHLFLLLLSFLYVSTLCWSPRNELPPTTSVRLLCSFQYSSFLLCGSSTNLLFSLSLRSSSSIFSIQFHVSVILFGYLLTAIPMYSYLSLNSFLFSVFRFSLSPCWFFITHFSSISSPVLLMSASV